MPQPVVARRLGLSDAEFAARCPNLLARGFPPPDPDTGNFDLHAPGTRELGAIVSITEILENIDTTNRGKEWPDPCGCFQRK